MARKRRRSRKKNRSRTIAVTVGLALAAAVAIVVVQFGLDPVGKALMPDRTTTAAIPSKARTELVSMPARMAAPAAKPIARGMQERTRLKAAEAPRPQRALSGIATPAASGRAVPRPAAAVPGPAAPSLAGLTPARKPQSGDCACPYDLMIDGSACGPRSTYLTPGREKPLCYR
jgi:hypothetical protein